MITEIQTQVNTREILGSSDTLYLLPLTLGIVTEVICAKQITCHTADVH